jgi:hypothetical protein
MIQPKLLNPPIHDNFFNGLSDSDGSIYGSARLKLTVKQNPSFSSSFFFEIEQASYNEGNCLAVMNHIKAPQSAYMYRKRDANTGEKKDYVVVRVNLNGSGGKKVMKIYEQTPPSSPVRLKQYLIAKVVLTKLPRGKNKKKGTVACTLTLLDHLSSGHPSSNLGSIRQSLRLTSQETVEGARLAGIYLQEIEKQVQTWENELETRVILSHDYLQGFHSGDGYFAIIYQVQNNRLRFIPTWGLSKNSKSLLIACKTPLKVGKVGPGNTNCFQYVVSGRDDFRNQVVNRFKTSKLPSSYKQNQWDTVYKAFQLLETKQHLTSEKAWRDFIDLTYAVSDVPKRHHSKEFYYALWQQTNS